MLITYAFVSLYDKNFKPLVVLWKPFIPEEVGQM